MELNEERYQLVMVDKKFGSAGEELVVEEFLTGREVSVLTFTDGKTVRVMTSAQDHKRALDGDKGLNTGGMGTFSPSPFYTKELAEYCEKNIFQPTVDAARKEGREFKGVIFYGLILTEKGPKLLEYNARFGDPEAQVVLPRMRGDIVEIMSIRASRGRFWRNAARMRRRSSRLSRILWRLTLRSIPRTEMALRRDWKRYLRRARFTRKRTEAVRAGRSICFWPLFETRTAWPREYW